jgi:hypothetical protein
LADEREKSSLNFKIKLDLIYLLMMREICASFKLERRILKGFSSEIRKMRLWK